MSTRLSRGPMLRIVEFIRYGRGVHEIFSWFHSKASYIYLLGYGGVHKIFSWSHGEAR